MNYQKLSDHLIKAHSLSLDQAALSEIVGIVNYMQLDNDMLEFAQENGFNSWDDYVAWTKNPEVEISARLNNTPD